MVPDQTLIKLDGVKKVFYTDEVETHALGGIHLDIKKGEYVSIAGPSGLPGRDRSAVIRGALSADGARRTSRAAS